MKKTIAITLIIGFFLSQGLIAAEAQEAINFPIKQLRSAPSEDSSVVFDIPVEVTLLDINDDLNWYKVRIAFAIGPFRYSYEGWTQIPIEQILAAEAGELPTLAQAPQK